jgi:hypothetical protein
MITYNVLMLGPYNRTTEEREYTYQEFDDETGEVTFEEQRTRTVVTERVPTVMEAYMGVINCPMVDQSQVQPRVFARLPMELCVIQFQSITQADLMTLANDLRFVVWTWEAYDEEGVMVANNHATPITAEDAGNLTLWVQGTFGLPELPAQFVTLLEAVTTADDAGQPLTRIDIEQQFMAAIRGRGAA